MADPSQLPVKIETEDEEFIVRLNDSTDYEDELLSPNQSSDYSEYQEYQDGSGKFRLKRRRKCGQCGPCQVKENCDKCHYCLRRDVLKQSCIYRKCLYLRKKVQRVRHDNLTGSFLDRSVSIPPSIHPISPPVMCVSPEDGLIRSPINSPDEVVACRVHPTSPPSNSVGPNPPRTPAQSPNADIPGHPQSIDNVGGFQPSTLSHRSPDNLRSYSRDAVRSHSVERPRSLQGDVRPMSCEAVPSSSSQGQTELSRHLSTNPYEAHLNSLQHMQNSSFSQMPKDQINPRTAEQLRHFDADPYRNMPSRPMMPHPAIPNPYAFPPGNIPQVSPASMGLSRACRYSMPGQPGFPPHFGYNSGFRPRSFSSPHASPIMSPPFYPPPHPERAGLPNLPIGQFPPHGTPPYNPARFHGAHPAMYPGSLYPSFRAQNEHFIYHAHLPPPWSVFSEHAEKMSAFRDMYLKKEKDEEERQKFDIFRLTKKSEKELMQENYTNEEAPRRGIDLENKKSTKSSDPKPNLDEDLVQKINSLSREDQCNVTISIDDLKMQAFIRSDGVNNLEIEIESPCSSLSPEGSVHKDSPSSVSSSESCFSSKSDQETGTCELVSALDSASKSKQTPSVKHTVSGTVCLKQDLGDEGIIQLELPGHRVQLEDLVLEDDLIKQSENPEELMKFISSPASCSPHFSEDIIIN